MRNFANYFGEVIKFKREASRVFKISKCLVQRWPGISQKELETCVTKLREIEQVWENSTRITLERLSACARDLLLSNRRHGFEVPPPELFRNTECSWGDVRKVVERDLEDEVHQLREGVRNMTLLFEGFSEEVKERKVALAMAYHSRLGQDCLFGKSITQDILTGLIFPRGIWVFAAEYIPGYPPTNYHTRPPPSSEWHKRDDIWENVTWRPDT